MKIPLHHPSTILYFKEKYDYNMRFKDIIIDGYNLIKTVPDFPSSNISLSFQRDHLVKILQSSPQIRSSKITVVFDGIQETKTKIKGQLDIIYSGSNKKADDIIQGKIREYKNPEKLLIISSDNDIQLTAKSHGARVMASKLFWDKIHQYSGKKISISSHQFDTDRELTDKEIQKWLKIFRDKNSPQDEK
jgi:predicted RNA-binding protein with PIN domain